MKQLTIFSSPDLERRVIDALERAGVEGYLRVGDATGNKFSPEDTYSRTETWEAVMLVVPGADDEQVETVTHELCGYADSCENQPCLRMVVSRVEAVF